MDRYTIKQMENMTDIDFATSILYERLNKLNPYSPLATKLKQTIKTLDKLQILSEKED